MAKDRRAELQKPGATLNGIDYVEIASPDQRELRVHFLNAITLAGTVTKVAIAGGDSVPEVLLAPIVDAADWSGDSAGRPLLTLRCAAPGDFSTYTLTLDSARLDTPYFNQARFSFKALCPSPLDCRTPAPECAEDEGGLPPIDYLAKDFLGFRKALSDYASLRYPDWKERAEADLGMVMMEMFSAVADDLSYEQDRVAGEAYLETATERVSLTRHARLVDYEPAPALAAQVWLQCEMSAPGGIPAGLLVSTATPEGAELFFEAGEGLDDAGEYSARQQWNELQPYWFDDAQRCLSPGATSMDLEGHGLAFFAGQRLLIETAGPAPGDPPRRKLIRLAEKPAEEITDAVFSKNLTRIFWLPDDALISHHDLTRTVVKGNIVPAVQGRRFVETFAVEVPPTPAPQTALALSRQGPRRMPVYRHSLRNAPLAWRAAGSAARPEIRLSEILPASTRPWSWCRWLLDASPQALAFTVDPAVYPRIRVNSDRSVQHDYAGGAGDTLRFGDGQFGNVPESGSLYEVTYRAGVGAAGNVAPDSMWRVEGTAPVAAVQNPFAATGGADPESAMTIVRRAPQAFRAVQYRAVRREDYIAAAETLPWAQRAGAAFRWTGSWITAFTTPDPVDSTALTREQRIELLNLLNRYRMAGYEAYVPPPRYLPLDLRIKVCARADAFRGDVQSAVLTALRAFFDPDNFSFGQPLERSALEAALQNASGVGGVLEVRYRRRGVTAGFLNLPIVMPAGQDEILLVENNPSRPERGSYHVEVQGGK